MVITLVAGVVVLALSVAPSVRDVLSPHVRPQSPRAAAVLREAISRSPTVARLVATIERSDVLVFLNVATGPDDTLARTTILGANEQVRLLHVVLNGRVSGDRLIELAGHELQHAVEIAQMPAIRDNESLGRAYDRIGWQVDAGHFETDAARHTEWQVGSEIRRRPARAKKAG
ncbi:MAG TPA: hypothetical protein VLT86_05155 [Vicinamibacterales bacterium]|nr:hypothetical protein [Vicinamibacterales bacterium]